MRTENNKYNYRIQVKDNEDSEFYCLTGLMNSMRRAENIKNTLEASGMYFSVKITFEDD